MRQFLNNNQFTTDGILYRLDKTIDHIQFLKEKYPEDREANKNFNWILEELTIIGSLVRYNPRFGWSEVQREMDRIYKVDKSITGYHLILDFKQVDCPRRPFINGIILQK